MGMSVRTVDELVQMHRSGRLNHLKAVCDIGVTQLDLQGNQSAVDRFLSTFGGARTADLDVRRVHLGYAAELWRACGLEYTAIDTSTEIPVLNLDLNFDSVPPAHVGRYQLVLNFGTTEHVCNQLNALKVIHDLCAPDGWMYHVVPFSAYQNHGFFRYNPKFFWSLCRSNDYGYADLRVDLSQATESLHRDIANDLSLFGHDLAEVAHFSACQGVLRVLLQKKSTSHFKPPFDGISGQMHNRIPDRYDGVFCEEPRSCIIRPRERIFDGTQRSSPN